MTTEGGGWTLLLTLTDATNQYSSSVNPFVTALNEANPSPNTSYSRDWSSTLNDDDTGISTSDQFMTKRADGDWIKFVISTWCGWSGTATSCGYGGGLTSALPFYAFGVTYDSSGSLLSDIEYFQGCSLGSSCSTGGCDGVGFGALGAWLECELYTCYAAGGLLTGATEACGFRWGSSEEDTSKPYTFWYRTNTYFSSPTVEPSFAPTPLPTTVEPSLAPTQAPSPVPSALPSPSPSPLPTSQPTSQPTPLPTPSPTSLPTSSPTSFPTYSPSELPTASPSALPTSSPTPLPTPLPTPAKRLSISLAPGSNNFTTEAGGIVELHVQMENVVVDNDSPCTFGVSTSDPTEALVMYPSTIILDRSNYQQKHPVRIVGVWDRGVPDGDIAYMVRRFLSIVCDSLVNCCLALMPRFGSLTSMCPGMVALLISERLVSFTRIL